MFLKQFWSIRTRRKRSLRYIQTLFRDLRKKKKKIVFGTLEDYVDRGHEPIDNHIICHPKELIGGTFKQSVRETSTLGL